MYSFAPLLYFTSLVIEVLCILLCFYSSSPAGGGPQGWSIRWVGRQVCMLGPTAAGCDPVSTHLAKLKLDPRPALPVGQRQVGQEGCVADNRRGRVPVLVCHPLTAEGGKDVVSSASLEPHSNALFCDVWVDGAGVAGVEMLQLRVGRVPQFRLWGKRWLKMSGRILQQAPALTDMDG